MLCCEETFHVTDQFSEIKHQLEEEVEPDRCTNLLEIRKDKNGEIGESNSFWFGIFSDEKLLSQK